jgi:hypothetical protein
MDPNSFGGNTSEQFGKGSEEISTKRNIDNFLSRLFFKRNPFTKRPEALDVNPANRQSEGYFNRGEKIGDLVVGIIISILIFVVCFVWATNTPESKWGLVLIAPFVLNIVAIILSFVKGRRFLGIGMIVTTISPFIFFGACLVLFSGI